MVQDRKLTQDLAWQTFLRDTRTLFRGSFLGWFWIIAPTLANSAVWIFLSSSVLTIDSISTPYPLFVFTGNLLWTAFNGGLIGGLSVLNEAKGTLSKVSFPHESLVLVVFYKALLNTCITALFLPVFLLLYPPAWRAEMLLFPAGLLFTLLGGLALGLILVPLTALFQDLSRAIQLGMRFAFFLTPVVFPLPASGFARSVMLWNPVTPLIVGSRGWLLGEEQPDIVSILSLTACSMGLLVLAVLALKISLPHIIERISGS